MKIFRIILSMYLLFVAFVPCHCDIHAACENNKTVTYFTQGQQCDNNSLPDLCTPFCSCSNSHSANYFYIYGINIAPAEHNERKVAFYILKKGDSFPQNSYTPPKQA